MLQQLQMMQLGFYSIKNLQHLSNQLMSEDSPIVLELFYKIMHKAQSNWLPQALAGVVNELMAEFFLDKAFHALDEDV